MLVFQVISVAIGLFAGLLRAGAETNSLPGSTNSPALVATSPLSAFTVRPGFRLELVAEAPQVEAPVAMAFDANGRLFVAEMRDYPTHRQETPHLGRIRLLEDTNGTGKFECSKVFAEDLPCPSALACYDGGLFVGASRDILYLKDTTGNGTADVRRTLFSGFGGTNAANADVFLNNFNWGPDNRIHGGTGGLGGIITSPNTPAAGLISLAESDFAFEPRSLMLYPEPGPAQSGLCFDNSGRRFLTDFGRPLRLAMSESRYAHRNLFAPHTPDFVDVLSPATAVFRCVQPPAPKLPLSADAGTNPPQVKAPARFPLASAWLTRACGTVIYRGSAFPSNYLDNVFIADPGAHVIYRAVLRENGLIPIASRAPGEASTEFLVSSDSSFHPMQLVNGPEGALYIADFGNGQGTGRIFRIVPEGFKAPEAAPLGQASPRDWVVALAAPDGWRRDTAARLLYERPDPTLGPLLSNMLTRSTLPLARLQALRVLGGTGALQESHLLKALQDPDYRVRELAVRFCEAPLRTGRLSETLWDALTARAADPSICVRYQLALTLGETADRSRLPALAKLLATDDNRWMRAAVFSSLAGSSGEMVVMLAREPGFGAGPAHAALLEQLATMTGVEGNEAQVNGLLEFIDRVPLDPVAAYALLSALGEGLHRAQSSLALVDPHGQLQRFYAEALALAANPDAAEPLRVQAIRLLGVSPLGFADIGDTLLLRLGSSERPAVQAAVLRALAHYDAPPVARALLARWPALPPSLHPLALATLLSWTNRVPTVLSAVETGTLRREDLPPAVQNALRTYDEVMVRRRALQLLGPVPEHHPEAVQRWQAALGLKGAPSRGRALFRSRCAECHTFGEQRNCLYPDLSAAKVAGKERLLLDILEPNANRKPGFAPSVVQTKPGELLLGLVCEENLKTFTLGQPNGTEMVWPRETIAFFHRQPWSLMPEGLTQGLSTQDVADLLEYLMTSP